jgi:hypothetical protein
MSELHLGLKTQQLLAEREVHTIVTGAVSGLMALYQDNVAVYQAPGNKDDIKALALMGRPIKQTHQPNMGGVKQAYHYAYTVGSNENILAGIVIANAIILGSNGLGTLDRHETMRQYTTRLTPQKSKVLRQDWLNPGKYNSRKLIGLTMEDVLRAPLGIELPEDDFVTAMFKRDILSIVESTPVAPMTNLLHTVIEI